MQKYRYIVRSSVVCCLALLALILSGTGAMASGPYGTASQAERNGCQSEGYKPIDTWDLKAPSGKRRPDIGFVQVLERPSPSNPSNQRLCYILKHDGKTWGVSTRTVLEVGSAGRKSGAQKLWFWDKGQMRYHTDGRAITPGSNRCAVAHVSITFKGVKYQRWVGPKQIDNKLICN